VLEIVVNIVFLLLSLALVLSFVRLVRGPTLPDRVVALELLVSITVGFIAVHSIASERANFLDVAVVLSLTAFLAAIGFARFLERGGPRHD
jgi:multicomponent Na+:H+ antiporter subunit F